MIQIRGQLGRLPAVPEPDALLPSINRQFAEDAKARIQEKASGGPGSRYLISRTGGTRASVFGFSTPTGAEVGASGPGVQVQEEGATIRAKNGRFLTFRLHEPNDTDTATGRWIRVRQVTIRAKYFVRDSVNETLLHLPEYLDAALREARW
ncbi:hypothetical protein [Deinococcus altitudinis]|uniref:hypothetical protein n=1 Tax=Deinococcus altitudinis TaxID=468914 RepID=UPI003891898C